MERKTILIIVISAALVLLVVGLLYWRHARITPRKYVPVKRRVEVPAVKKKAALPSIVKKFDHPKVAIVMDDFGYNMNNVNALFSIKKPVTLSILPRLPYSAKIAESARAKGYEVILHLPLEPHRKDVRQEVDTINSRMGDEEVIRRVETEIKNVPGIDGVSNHMGSKSTEEKALMSVILGDLKKHNLYFFDSLTSNKSVCQKVAKEFGVPYAKRDVFLDMGDANDIEYIKKQVLAVRKIAFRRGHAIAVCHDRINTVKVLSEMMPALSDDGIDFVYVSQLIK